MVEITQYALNQRSPAEGKGKAQKLQKQHALKGQKLLAQGIALGGLKKVPNFKLHSLFLNFNSCPRSISSFKSGILFWTGI